MAALGVAFGVEPYYLLDCGEPVFDRELMADLRNEAIRESVREITRLSTKKRRLVSEIVRPF